MELINTFYNEENPVSKRVYVANLADAREYKGFLLFHYTVNPWVDVVEVRDGQYFVISQRVTLANAKGFIDAKLSQTLTAKGD
jgi:hypothetical protein